jgi:hypothetical protein
VPRQSQLTLLLQHILNPINIAFHNSKPFKKSAATESDHCGKRVCGVLSSLVKPSFLKMKREKTEVDAALGPGNECAKGFDFLLRPD